MNHIFTYTPVGDLITFMICVIMLLSLFESFINNSKNFHIFLIALITTGFTAVTSVCLYSSKGIADINVYYQLYFRSLNRIGMIAILESYIFYVVKWIEVKGKEFIIGSTIINCILGTIDIAIGFLGLVDPYDPFTMPLFLAYAYSVLICMILLTVFRNRVIARIRYGLILSAAYAVSIIIIEYLNGNNNFMVATFLFPILVVMFLAHSNSYDTRTGALNIDSFGYYLEKQHKTEHAPIFACLKFYTGGDFVMPDELQILMRNFWGKRFKDAKLFHPISNMFILAIHDKNATKVMKDLFDQLFQKYYDDFGLDYKILVFPKIKEFHSFRDVNQTFEYLGNGIPLNSYKEISLNEMDQLKRGFYILNQLWDIHRKADLNDPRVLTYYQPIKNLATGEYDTAESLMRLNLEELGIVYPDEFIPLIEQNDLMHTFSMIMLHKVCEGLKKLETVKRISVNFSVSELKHENFVTDFEKIIAQSGVSYDQIGVEFTENMNDSEFQVIKNVVYDLKNLGCIVYLDDFGTGYNNFDRVLGLNMNVIKFDRSLLMLTKDDEKAKYIIDAFSETFAKMGFEILYEGVETVDQEKLCIDSKANYLQGFKYSRPVDFKTYYEFLKK